jgi:hypothetical protein
MNTDKKDILKLTSKEKAPEPEQTSDPEHFTHKELTYVSAGYIDEPDADVEVQKYMYVFVVNRVTGAQIDAYLCWIYNTEDAVASRWTRVLTHLIWATAKTFTVGEPDPAYPKEPAWIAGPGNYAIKTNDIPLRNRLWCVGEENRLFTNFPQKSNWLKYLTLNKVSLAADTELVIEVTDSNSGRIYETLTFRPTEQRLQPAQWHEDFYKLINSKGIRIKAGVWNASAVLDFNPDSTAVWIPRNSELDLVVTSTGSQPVAKADPDSPKTEEPQGLAPTFLQGLLSNLVTVPYTGLPDMTGFETDELGVPENSWLSPSYLLADRDLDEGEALHAWLIRLEDGEPLEHVTFTADINNRLKKQWPQAFAKYINEQAKQIRAGGWNDEGDFTDLSRSASPEEFAGLDIVGKSELNRLWHYSRNNRAFSTAAYRNNWVQTLTLSDAALNADTTLWVQVRDITSQHLYETHIFTPNPKRLGAGQWTKDVCEQINRDGQMLRGGVMQTNGQIKAEDKQNSLWIPQCSDLAVTLAPVTWWTQQTVTAENDLAEGESISTYVWDEYSNAELIKPHCFTPANESERKKENWVGAWAKSLNASALKPYVSMGTKSQRLGEIKNGEMTASIWEVGASLRVFTTEPSGRNWVEHEFVLDDIYQDITSSADIALTDYKTFTNSLKRTFTPDSNLAKDKPSWIENLFTFLNTYATNIQFLQQSVSHTSAKKSHNTYNFLIPKHANLKPELTTRAQRSLLQDHQITTYGGVFYSPNGLIYLAAYALLVIALYSIKNKATIDSSQLLTIRTGYELWLGDIRFYADMGRLDSVPNGLEKLDRALKDYADTTLLPHLEQVIKNGAGIGIHDIYSSSSIGIEDILLKMTGISRERSSAQNLDTQPLFNLAKLHIIEISNMMPNIIYFRAKDTDAKLNGTTVISELYSRTELAFHANMRSNTSDILTGSSYVISDNHLSHRSSNLVIRLTPKATLEGVRLISGRYVNGRETAKCTLHFPQPFIEPKLVNMIIGRSTDKAIWEKLDNLYLPRPIEYEGAAPTSPLCEDYGNTFRSEVFDVSGLNSTGVDPRTGLFNAHYPLAKLTGLDGKGPTCDLTLHYSPLRANESGLGDGWAFNFSWYDSRPRLLTLSNGQTIQFSESELASLKNGQSVSQLGYSITATAARSSGELESIEILMPSGSRETLAKASGDSTEHNEAFVKTIIEKLKEAQRKIPEFIASTHPLKNETWYQNAILIFMGCFPGMREVALKTEIEKQRAVANWEAYWEKRRPELLNRVKSEIDYWSRPELQYVPSKITSDFGGALIFNWKREGGQYFLETVKTTDEVLLLSAAYTPATAPTETAGIQSTATFTIWPDTPDAYIVTLHLNNYLLKTIVRSNTVNNPTQTVQYGYGPDPTLDRVLTSIFESDGSLEKVFYEAGGMRFPTIDGAEKFPLPRVTTHIVSPGVNATPLRTDWQYSEHNYLGRGDENTAAYAFPRNAYYHGNQYRYWSSETACLGNSIKRTWNAFHLQTEEVETSPEGASKTASWQYPYTGLRTDPAFGLPLAINTTYLDVSPATSEEAKS